MRYIANAPIERNGEQYEIGETFDVTGMDESSLAIMVQGGALLVVEDESKAAPEEERVTWQEQS